MHRHCSVLFAMLLTAWPSMAWASCGAASCPLDTATMYDSQAGRIRLSYQWEFIDQDDHRLGRHSAEFGEVTGHHDERGTRTVIQRLGADIGVTDRFGLDVRLPFIVRDHAHRHRHQGAFHEESWDLNGQGDLTLLGRYTFLTPSQPTHPELSFMLGGELPTGRTHIDNRDGAEAEPGVQPGSHSWDLITGIGSRQVFSAPTLSGEYAELPVFASLQAQFNGKSVDDYRLGDTFSLNIGTSYPLTRRVGLLSQVNVLVRDRDGKGRTGEEVQKTGGEAVYFSPGLEWRASDDWRAYAMVQLPVYQRVNSLQVVSEYNVLFGVEYRFQLWGERPNRSDLSARP